MHIKERRGVANTVWWGWWPVYQFQHSDLGGLTWNWKLPLGVGS